MRSTAEPARDDRVLRVTRVLAVVIVPFLVVAAFLLFAFPTRTGELFAWPIDPPLSAYLLASAYVGGIWFFVATALTRGWHRVQHGFPAVIVFAGALLVATLLHLDRFSQNLSFWTWIVLYVTTPFAVAAVWFLQRPRAQASPDAVDVTIPALPALALAGIGACAFVFGAVVFVAPQLAAPVWPWDLTPLTGRVTGAVLSLTGVVNAALIWDRRWSAFRVLFSAQLVSLVAIVASLIAGREALHPDRPLTVVFVALVAGAAVSYGAFAAWCELRMRRAAVSAARA